MRNIFFFISAVTAFTLSTQAFAGQKVKRCSPAAEQKVQDSIDFLNLRIESIMNRVGDLTDAEKRRLRRKVDSVNVKCMDDRPVCENHDTRGGVSRHLFDSAVVICYNRIRDVGGAQASCLLSEVIFHEFAHTANVDKDSGHNNGPNDDRVYRVGYAAGHECSARGLASSIPANTND